jgi:ABC-type branched-subunit amino acid transport system substrate-binding protein
MNRGQSASVCTLLIVVLAAAACSSSGRSSSSESSAPGVTATQVSVGLVTSLTGLAAANFTGAEQGAAARFALQNAAGGVDGRTIKMTVADDQSSPTGAKTAVDSLSSGTFGQIFISDFTTQAYRTTTQGKIPVVGAPNDGPEWGEQPNTNMVSILGNQGPVLPASTLLSQVAKSAGATNMASLAIGNEEPSIAVAKSFVTGAEADGLNVGYQDYSIPIGSVDVTSVVLAMKAAHVDGFYSAMLNNTNFALMTAAQQAGLRLKAPIQIVGYGQDLLNDPAAVRGGQGAIFDLPQAPVELNTPATRAETAAFAKYEHFTGVPSFNWSYGWLSADLFIRGLEAAGRNLTRASFLAKIRTISWDGGGLLPGPVDLSLAGFGKAPATSCAYFAQLKGGTFVPMNGGKPYCGHAVGS